MAARRILNSNNCLKQRKRYFLKQYSQTNYWHGGIGYTHMEQWLEKAGYQPISFAESSVLYRFWQLLSWLFRVKRRDCVVFIYPVYPRLYRLFLWLLRQRRQTLLCVVGDIDGLKDDDHTQLKRDIHFFRRQTHVLAHNAAMERWLRSIGCRAKVEHIEFFPYLVPPVHRTGLPGNEVVFAGNLSKSRFLLQLKENNWKGIDFRLYGDGLPVQDTLPSHLHWKGRFPPEEMPSRVEGHFGLLWDGDDCEQPAGPIGQYMAYISHHKLSLYILAGLPILAPKMAGSAELINREGVGILLDSMADIETIIRHISEERYQEMQKRLHTLAQSLSDGSLFLQALQRLCND